MTQSAKSVFDRFNLNLDIPLFVLLGSALVELVLYRLLANMGFYVGVGSEGPRALMADFSIFAMVFTGALAAILLFWGVARLVNHPFIAGFWWRGVLIFISPLYLLTIFWSIWTSLTHWVLAAALVSVQLTVLLVCVISILRPVPHSIKRFFAIVGLMLLVGAVKWIFLDFLQISPVEKWGRFLLNAYEVAQFFMVALPYFAYFLFVADSREKVAALLRKPHVPALLVSIGLTALAFGVLLFIQQVTHEGNLWNAGRYVARVAYHTLGLKFTWPMAAVMGVGSFFFLCMTAASLLLHFGTWKPSRSDREIGFGLAMLYIAGLQPFSVYQTALSLLGVILLAVGVADREPARVSYPDLKDMMDELDGPTESVETREPSSSKAEG
ncbi:MAG: hypothetical protein JXX29_01160 [Deltaproteobacteria bacterium]|nr:hypothetical protein [Deltaproteobacteria bacterium]MBN2670247.1 hypothetical protein [Deltaproteobacteria bacterium]